MIGRWKQKRWVMLGVLLAVLMTVVSGVTVIDKSVIGGQGIERWVGGEKVITLGHIAYAAGDVDFTFDGTDDDVQFQAALNALPATGGRLVVVSAVQINFSNTVTRAIGNVTIEGAGAGTYFVNDGATTLFTAGGDGWHFANLRTDAGGLDMGETTGWLWTNVTVDTQLYTYYAPTTGIGAVYDLRAGSDWDIGDYDLRAKSFTSDVATGTAPFVVSSNTTVSNLSADLVDGYQVARIATYVVAASDAPAHAKAQADYVCDGTADNVEIQAAIDALPSGGGKVVLSEGKFILTSKITAGAGVSIIGTNHCELDVTGLDDTVFEVTEASVTHWKATELLANFTVTADAANTNTKLLKLENISHCTIRDIEANDLAYFAEVRGPCFMTTFDHVSPEDGVIGIQFVETADGKPNDSRVLNSEFHSFSTSAIHLGGGYHIKVLGNYFEANAVGVDVGSGAGNPYAAIITGNSFSMGTDDIGIDVNATKAVISNNHFETSATGVYGVKVNGAHEIIVTGNIVDFESAGTLLGTFVSLTSSNIRGTISNNLIRYASAFISASAAYTERLVVDDNYCRKIRTFISNCYNEGSISNNYVEDNDGGTFIHITDTCTIVGNRVYNASTRSIRSNGNCVIKGNILESCAAIEDATGDTIEGNDPDVGIGETRTFRKTVNYNDTSPVAVCSVEDGYAVTDVWVEVVTTFDDTGPQALDIGDGVDPDGFLANANINLGAAGYYGVELDERGDYLWDAANAHARTKVYTGSDTVDCTIGAGNGDGTQGQAIVYVKVTRIGG